MSQPTGSGVSRGGALIPCGLRSESSKVVTVLGDQGEADLAVGSGVSRAAETSRMQWLRSESTFRLRSESVGASWFSKEI